MNPTQKGVMEAQYAYLVKHVNALELHPKLVGKGLVDQSFHQRLRAKETREEQVQVLLTEIFRSPDPECFNKFDAALREAGVPHATIAQTLRKAHDEATRTEREPVTPMIAGRSRTEPPVSTGNTAGQLPLPSPSAPVTTPGTGGAGHQATSPSTVGQGGHLQPQEGTDQNPPPPPPPTPNPTERNFQPPEGTDQSPPPPPPPQPPPKKAPAAENCLAHCPEGNIDDVKDVSFAILVANKNEYLTVLNYFGMGFKIVSEKQPYTDDVLKRTFESDPVIAQNGDEAPEPQLSRRDKYYSICINGETGLIYRSVAIGSGGRYGAMMSTISLLKAAKDHGWPLKIIFAVGCAGGRTGSGQTLELGQVIVPKSVVEFNRGKVESGADGQPVFKRDPEMWSTSASWFESLTDSAIHHFGEEGHSITVASGVNDYCSDLVVKDPGMAEELRGLIADPKVIGIEMEGVGMATAINIMKTLEFYYIIKEVPEFLVVKGISDNADGAAKGTPAPMTFFETSYKDVYPDDRQVMATLQSVTLVARAIHKHGGRNDRPAIENGGWCQML